MDKKALPVPQQALSPVSASVIEKIVSILHEQDRDKTRKSYNGLFSQLDSIPTAERGDEWVMAVLMLNGLSKKKANITFNWLNRLGARMAENNRSAEFDNFVARLQTMMHPITIGSHGYLRSLASMDGGSVAAQVGELIGKINSWGYQCFINSGTLLGAVRDGRFIGHDDDVDLAVVLPGHETRDVALRWIELVERFRHEGMLDLASHGKSGLPIAKISIASGVGLDIFPAWIDSQDRFFLWPHTFGDIAAEQVFPLGSVNLHGRPLPAPAQPEAMLVLNYGPNWQTPDPTFIFPWRAARKKFRSFIDATKQNQEAVTA